jgi:hypothetical protein
MKLSTATAATRAKWEARVDAWRASGMSAPEFCAGKEFTTHGLRYWAYRLRREHSDDLPNEAMTTKTERRSSGAKREIRLARVVEAKREVETAIVMEIGEARVGLRRGFDRETLRALLEMLVGEKK